MAMPTTNPSTAGMPGMALNVRPITYAESPSTDPTDRSTLRVRMTMRLADAHAARSARRR